MRILTLTHEYPPVGGGGGRVALDVCRGLAANGHEVRVLTAHWDDLPSQEEQDGVTIFRVKSLRRWPYKADMVAMAGFVAASLFHGLAHIRRWKPDIIHVHFAVPAGASAWLLSVLTGTPYVLTAHLGDVPGGVPEKTSGWFRWIYPFTPLIWKRASHVVGVSEFTRSLALAHYNVPMDVILNGVDLEKINPGEITVQKPPRIVFAGRFMQQKNPIQLVRTLAALKDLDWTCALIGDGPLRQEVEDEIERLGVVDRFDLPGWLTPQEVLEWFGRSDILFMPSRSEGLPVVGVQAVAMGLALVLSAVGGCVDLIDEGVNGYLLDREDQDGFEQALRNLLEDPHKLQSFRMASRQWASRFDLNAVVESYEQVFFQVVNKVEQD